MLVTDLVRIVAADRTNRSVPTAPQDPLTVFLPAVRQHGAEKAFGAAPILVIKRINPLGPVALRIQPLSRLVHLLENAISEYSLCN